MGEGDYNCYMNMKLIFQSHTCRFLIVNLENPPLIALTLKKNYHKQTEVELQRYRDRYIGRFFKCRYW